MTDTDREDLRAALNGAFPDSRSTATDAHVDQLRSMFEDPAGARAAARRDPQPVGAETAIYVATATHKRVRAPHSEFAQDLVMARVDLPATEPEWTLPTMAGEVHATDHKLPSVAHVRRDWEDWIKERTNLTGEISRVELVTPPRLSETRFSAITTYIGYFGDDPKPAFLLLEAGLATGEAATLYWAVDWEEDPDQGVRRAIVPPQQAGYSPTPFASHRDYYGGHIAFDLDTPQEIVSMHVDALDRERAKYIEVDIAYQRSTSPTLVWPAFITAAAGLRVGAIALALGEANALEAGLGLMGHTLPWKRRP